MKAPTLFVHAFDTLEKIDINKASSTTHKASVREQRRALMKSITSARMLQLCRYVAHILCPKAISLTVETGKEPGLISMPTAATRHTKSRAGVLRLRLRAESMLCHLIGDPGSA